MTRSARARKTLAQSVSSSGKEIISQRDLFVLRKTREQSQSPPENEIKAKRIPCAQETSDQSRRPLRTDAGATRSASAQETPDEDADKLTIMGRDLAVLRRLLTNLEDDIAETRSARTHETPEEDAEKLAMRGRDLPVLRRP